MGEVVTDVFDPIARIALLSYLSASYANQLEAARRLGSGSIQGLQRSIEEVGKEAIKIGAQFGISEEDFFEATFQSEGWQDRITYGKEGE